MAGNTTNALSFNIVATDDITNNVPVNFSLGQGYDSTSASLIRYRALIAGSNSLTVFTFPVSQVYVRNIDSALSVTLTWTPNGGSATAIILLNPGDFIILWTNPAGATTPGISTLSATPSAAGCLIEYFVGK
jgi:hypothetical protein